MCSLDIIDKYYSQNEELKEILLTHSRSVAEKCLSIADAHPELKLDREFLYDAAMFHDIGIFMTNAPRIYCKGSYPYICHGYLGAKLLRKEGYLRYARVCERHTGAGLSLHEIETQQLPIPHHDMLPESLEEELICFSDKFFSKTHLEKERSVDEARASIAKYGEESLARFNRWCELFL